MLVNNKQLTITENLHTIATRMNKSINNKLKRIRNKLFKELLLNAIENNKIYFIIKLLKQKAKIYIVYKRLTKWKSIEVEYETIPYNAIK